MNKKVRVINHWKYVIAISFVIFYLLCIVCMDLVPLIIADEEGNDMNGDNASNTILHIIYAFSAALGVASLFVNVLLKKMTMREIALFGTVLMLLGDVTMYFSKSSFMIIVTYGIIKGTGVGILLPVFYIALDEYFADCRTTALYVLQSIPTIGGISLPFVINYIKDSLGYRGNILIFLGIDLHMIPASLALLPVGWNFYNNKEVKVIFETCESPIKGNNEKVVKAPEKEYIAIAENELPLNNKNDDTNNRPVRDASTKLSGFWGILSDMFDMGLLSDKIFLNILFALSIGNFCEYSFISLYPTIMLSNGFTKNEVATTVSLNSLALLLSNIALLIGQKYIKIKSRLVYALSLFACCFLQIAFLYTYNFIMICVITFAFSTFRAWTLILYIIKIADYVSVDKYPAACCLACSTSAVSMVICGQLFSYINDGQAGKDKIIVFLSSGLLGISVILYILERVVIYFKTKSSPMNQAIL